MRLPIYQVDAFTEVVFKGNYAAVVPLQHWLADEVMQAIASENNLSETAFFVRDAEGVYRIRWFSPLMEIPFCGHATLASAFVIFNQQPDVDVIAFDAEAVGRLNVARLDDGFIEMRFPLRPPTPLDAVPDNLRQGLSIPPVDVLISGQAYVAVYATEAEVRNVVPVLPLLATLAPRDVVITAPGADHDFVSRYFWPANGGDEDPVTGSIHATLVPYWAERLGKQALLAMQVSHRSGLLRCRLAEDHVFVSGKAVQYLEGFIDIPVS